MEQSKYFTKEQNKTDRDKFEWGNINRQNNKLTNDLKFSGNEIMTRNYGVVFCFVECINFEKADFFLRSAVGDFLSSDSFVKGTSNAVVAGQGDDRPLVSSGFTAVR